MSFEGGSSCLRERFTRWSKFAIAFTSSSKSASEVGRHHLFVWGKELTKAPVNPAFAKNPVALNSKEIVYSLFGTIRIMNIETEKDRELVQIPNVYSSVVVVEDFIFCHSSTSLYRYSLTDKKTTERKGAYTAIGKHPKGLVVALGNEVQFLSTDFTVLNTHELMGGGVETLRSLSSGKIVVHVHDALWMDIVDISKQARKRVNLLNSPSYIDTFGERILLTCRNGAMTLFSSSGKILSSINTGKRGISAFIDENTTIFATWPGREGCRIEIWDLTYQKKGIVICDTNLGLDAHPYFIVPMPPKGSELKEKKETDKLFVSFLVNNSPLVRDTAGVIAQFI
jgi:hypothetical protein